MKFSLLAAFTAADAAMSAARWNGRLGHDPSCDEGLFNACSCGSKTFAGLSLP